MMRQRIKELVFLFLAGAFLNTVAQTAPPPGQDGRFTLPPGVSAKDYRPGVIIVKLKPESSGSAKVQSAVTALSRLRPGGAGIVSLTRRFKTASNTVSASSVLRAAPDNGLDRIYELVYSGQENIVTVINELMKQGNLEYAEPDYIYHHYYTPDDALYASGQQAYLGIVKAAQAWNLNRNSSPVVIGIVDSGSDLNHEDLSANIYLNTADPVNGDDDDNDGYPDNYYGWDMVGASGSSIREDNDPGVKSDTTAHGVHVSGIASAVSNNGTGVASIAGNARLLIVKCGADNTRDAIYRGYDGIKYAADHGANIINCSWGGSGGGSYGRDIVNYAIGKGCLLVAAAGNDNTSILTYPAAYPGVLAVASVTNNDVRSAFSNYGTYVRITAPGNSILSTLPGNKYGLLSGTSMAAPVVSSAAALLKACEPLLTMAQVGERLIATSDNIDAKNPFYAGLIGKGRLNVYRALTESPPAVRFQQITTKDKGAGNFPAGETMDVFVDLENFLAPVANLNINLSTTSDAVSITTSDIQVGSLATSETKTMIGPFKVFVKNGIPDNTEVTMKLSYSGNNGDYISSENFSVVVALDYLNVEVNQVSTTFTSNGRVGYSLHNARNGLGFVYKNESLLYESSLMIGNSPVRVSDNARTGSSANEHFVKVKPAAKTAGTTAAFEATSEFDDSNNPLRLQVDVRHRMLAFDKAPDDKYVIAEYEVINQSGADLEGVYIGMLTDFDIGGGTSNVTHYDALNRIAYVHEKTGSGVYGAVKLLSTTAPPSYYPMSYMIAGDPMFDSNFTTAEKFAVLSGGIKAAGLGENALNGYDVLFSCGYGPYDIPAGGSVKVAFAFIGGDNLADIQASAAAAQVNYERLNPGINAGKFALYQNYPNPVAGNTTIAYTIPRTGNVKLSLYNLAGQRVRTYLDETVGAGNHSFTLNSTDLPGGVYIYRMQYNKESQAIKLMVAR
jgi:subtilisin family serine protease